METRGGLWSDVNAGSDLRLPGPNFTRTQPPRAGRRRSEGAASSRRGAGLAPRLLQTRTWPSRAPGMPPRMWAAWGRKGERVRGADLSSLGWTAEEETGVEPSVGPEPGWTTCAPEVRELFESQRPSLSSAARGVTSLPRPTSDFWNIWNYRSLNYFSLVPPGSLYCPWAPSSEIPAAIQAQRK